LANGATQIRIEGVGLISGKPAVLIMEKRPGPVLIQWSGLAEAVALRACAARAERHTSVLYVPGAPPLYTVEHLASALGGLGVYQDLSICVEGDDIPFCDGASLVFARALQSLRVTSSRPPVRIARNDTVCIGSATYSFTPANETVVVATLVTERSDLATSAVWKGGAKEYIASIAPARTFLFEKDVDAYLNVGVTSHVDPASFILVGDKVYGQGANVDEPVRHKLLDLIGDLYLYGGPPLGHIEVLGGGHHASHEAFQKALSKGILVPS
jgi:UDP-3-O-acyl-N-acetylglucosamine deacetylase